MSGGIIKVKKKSDYTAIRNATLRDKRLSFAARGLLAYLLSRPDDWKVSTQDLINQSSARRAAVHSILRELKAAGYMRRERTQGDGGKIVWETVVYEKPCDEREPCVGCPSMDEPSMGEPSTVNRHTTKERKNQRTKDEDSPARPSVSQPGANAPYTPPAQFSVLSYLEFLSHQPAYDHINPVVEASKVSLWHQRPANRRRRITERFLQKWVGRIERPLPEGSGEHESDGRPETSGRGDQRETGARRVGRLDRIEQTYASRDYERLADESI